jgi:cell wall-associated NlpC family hydrolase
LKEEQLVRTIGALCATLTLSGAMGAVAQARTHALFSTMKPATTLAAIAAREHVILGELVDLGSVDAHSADAATPGTTLALTDAAPSAVPPADGSPSDVVLTPAQARQELRELQASIPPGAAAVLKTWGQDAKHSDLTAPIHRLAAGIVHRTSAIATSLTRNAMRFIGTPYVFGGTSPSGFDCSGYVQHVFAMIGIHLPRTADVQFYAGHRIDGTMTVGDLVFFQTYEPGPSHVGIYLGNGHFIHSSSHGVMVSSLSDSYWRARYLGAKRVANLR